MNEQRQDSAFEVFVGRLLHEYCRISGWLRGHVLSVTYHRTRMSRVGVVSLVMTDLVPFHLRV